MPKLQARRAVTLGIATAALAMAVEAVAAPLAIAPAPGIRLQSYHAYGSMRRQTVAVATPATFAIPVEIPEGARLIGGLAVPDQVWKTSVVDQATPLRFRVSFRSGDDTIVLYDRVIDIRARTDDRRWFDFGRDLSALAGRRGELEFATTAVGDATTSPLALWSVPELARCPEAGPSLLLITLDAMRADHQSGVGYPRATTPHLDAFGADATRFTAAYAAAPKTIPSIPQTLTGRYFPAHGPVAALAPLLGPGRFGRRRAIVNNPHVSRWLDAQEPGFDVRTTGELDAHAITSEALRFLSAAGRCRTALYLHYLEPHTPYRPPARYARKFVDLAKPTTLGLTFDDVTAAWQGRYGAVDRQRIVDLYDGTIAFVDRQLGRLFRGLARRGRLDDTIVIVTADHGEEFWEHGQFFHGQSLFDELLHVPLIIRLPRAGRAHIVDDVVSTVDIVPTILDAAGFPPATTDGLSLVPAIRRATGHDDTRVVFATVSDAEPRTPFRHAVRSGRTKLIRHIHDGALATYDLASDPAERQPDATPPDARELRSVLDAVRLRIAGTGYQVRLDSRLPHETSYVLTISGASPASDEDDAPSPVKLLDVDRLTLEASDTVQIGRHATSLTVRGKLHGGDDDHLRFDIPATIGTLRITLTLDEDAAPSGAIRLGATSHPDDTPIDLANDALDEPPARQPVGADTKPPPPVTVTLWRVPIARGAAVPPPPSPEEEARLRALGYLD